MQTVVVTEIMSILFLIMPVIGLAARRDYARSSQMLSLCCKMTILATVADAASFFVAGPSFSNILIGFVRIFAYAMGPVNVLVLTYYCYCYISEKTSINKYLFYVPMGIIGLDIVYVIIVGITSGYFSMYGVIDLYAGTMMDVSAFIQTVVMVYLPAVCMSKRKEIGEKSAYIFGIYWVLPVVSFLYARFFGGMDYSCVAMGISITAVYILAQNYRSIQKEREQRSQLKQKNAELEKQIEEVTDLYARLQNNQTQLENAAKEQRERIVEISALNETLENHMHIIKSMGKVYFSAFYIDIANNSFIELTSMDNIRNLIGSRGNAQESLALMCEKLIQPEFSEAMREFSNLSTVGERLKDRDFITLQYKGATTGWSQAYLIAGDSDEHGNILHVFFATRLIHEEKEKEEKQNAILEKAREDAEAANAAKTSFLFNMSHDIRTPMNAIIGFRDLLEKHQEDPDRRKSYLRKIEDASYVLLSIIDNVLEMARIEKGTLEIDESAWAVEQFNDTIFSIFHELMIQKNIEFVRNINVSHPYVYCDAIKLREIFINILSNAYKYTNSGGKVTMSLEELPGDKDGYIIYKTTISDTGVGMEPEFIPHLFEEFSREKTSTDNSIEGTGLGMSIVKRLVDILNGTIEVYSSKDIGTTFVVCVPHRIADKDALVSNIEIKLNPKLFIGKKILLAEDNELNAEITIEILREAGFEVEWVQNGDMCVEKVRASEAGCFDLVLMDIQMPVMNGYDATRAIRGLSDADKASIPIVAMTANAFEEDKREAYRCGMNGHLSKPINVKELFTELTKALG